MNPRINIPSLAFLICLFLMSPKLIGQFNFEASEAHPYGFPNRDAPPEILDFAPMIGVCDCLSETRKQDQSWAEPVKMTWKFKYIMNGMGVQDETLKEDETYSGSIRQFDPESKKWYVHYYSHPKVSKQLSVWEGNKKDDKIVLYRDSKAPNGNDGYYRLTFYDMSDEGYKWIGEWTSLDETIVYPTWKISCKRR